ncbi:MAG: hypothetical protein PHH96_09620 [Smithellaceae bacterium]|nr:hypothetical protein [Smithellaceae bacterium]
MALDLTGIANENEFYTHHYLTAILENDLKGFFNHWAEREQQGVKPPYDQLARLHRDYFALRNRMERVHEPADIMAAQREILPELLAILGYEFVPAFKELDSGAIIPIIAEVRKPSGVPELWIIETVTPITENTDPLESSFVKAQYETHMTVPVTKEDENS